MTALFAAIAFLTMDMHGITAPTAAREWTVIVMRLIDADKFILALMDAGLFFVDEDTILDLVDSVPTVDAVPVAHGRWIERRAPHAIGGFSAKCSVCGRSVQYLGNPLNYCPNCGAKMKEVE